jgi:hypothetical protein
MTLLIGSQSYLEAGRFANVGEPYATKYKAKKTGSVEKLIWKCSSPPKKSENNHLILGLYSDNEGAGGKDLPASASPLIEVEEVIAGGIKTNEVYTFNTSKVSITEGKYYWLAFMVKKSSAENDEMDYWRGSGEEENRFTKTGGVVTSLAFAEKEWEESAPGSASNPVAISGEGTEGGGGGGGGTMGMILSPIL